MPFSYTSIIYSEITEDTYFSGMDLAKKNKVEIIKSYNNGCKAIIHESDNFPVTIGFARIGSPSYSCVCVAYSYDCVCEHIAATAIAYDHSRGVFFTLY